jgi:hypothetical protein
MPGNMKRPRILLLDALDNSLHQLELLYNKTDLCYPETIETGQQMTELGNLANVGTAQKIGFLDTNANP